MAFDPVSEPRIQAIGESGCWIWTGWTGPDGYGLVGREGRNVRVHRLQMANKLGREISRAEVVCHVCDTPSCVNPDHLFIGTQAENMRDMARKKRAASGISHHAAKLTAAQVIEIFTATETHDEIAHRFGVKRECVGKIKRGERWRKVTEELATTADPTRRDRDSKPL